MIRPNNQAYTFTLDNGLRVIVRPNSHSEVVHCGVIINVGSRDEDAQNNGAAHFIEHTVFKGTTHRKSHHLLRRIEDVGGEINAYTTREKTVYYASALRQFTGRAVELVADLTLHPTFPEKEIEKEKTVILDEIEMYEDNPEESIYDDFYLNLFGGHPLGYNILGTRSTVPSFTQADLKGFISQFYTPGNMVLSMAGNITERQARHLAAKHFGPIPPAPARPARIAPAYHAFSLTQTKDYSQTHCIIGAPAYDRYDPKRFILALINNILGGSGMSSRLSLGIREKYGYTYGISSGYSNYADAGVFSIYFACDQKYLRRCQELVLKELRKLRTIPLTERQLHTAKAQYLGAIAMMEESQSMHMQGQAKALLDFGRLYTYADLRGYIERITPGDIIETSTAILSEDKLSTLIYKAEEE